MNKYELALAVSGKLDNEAANAVVDKAKALIERFGGKINSVDSWGKKTFAYEVHKQRDGYYNFVKFEAESDAPAEIESRMRIMDDVLRYLIVSDDDEIQIAAPKEEKSEGSPAEAASSHSENKTEEAAEEAPAADNSTEVAEAATEKGSEEAAPEAEAPAEEAAAEAAPSEEEA